MRSSSLIACPSLKEEEAPSSCGEETEVPSAEVQCSFMINVIHLHLDFSIGIAQQSSPGRLKNLCLFKIIHCSCTKQYLLTLNKLGFLNHCHDVVINLLVQPFKIKNNNFLLSCLLLKLYIFPSPRCHYEI